MAWKTIHEQLKLIKPCNVRLDASIVREFRKQQDLQEKLVKAQNSLAEQLAQLDLGAPLASKQTQEMDEMVKLPLGGENARQRKYRSIKTSCGFFLESPNEIDPENRTPTHTPNADSVVTSSGTFFISLMDLEE